MIMKFKGKECWFEVEMRPDGGAEVGVFIQTGRACDTCCFPEDYGGSVSMSAQDCQALVLALSGGLHLGPHRPRVEGFDANELGDLEDKPF